MNVVSREISIASNVDRGVYCFEPESATGKTRLYQLVKLLKQRGLNVDGYSYASFLDGVSASSVDRDIVLFVVDRYDMYPNTINELIEELSETALVVIDSKLDGLLLKVPVCGLLEVTLKNKDTVWLEDVYA